MSAALVSVAGDQPAAISLAGSTTSSPPMRSHKAAPPTRRTMASIGRGGTENNPVWRPRPLRKDATISASATGARSATRKISPRVAGFCRTNMIALTKLSMARSDRRLRKAPRSEEHTSELQSLAYLVCRLLLEKKKKIAFHYREYKKKRIQNTTK